MTGMEESPRPPELGPAPEEPSVVAGGLDARNVVLVGPMGAGKSTVGAALARRLGRPHVDSDQFFVARHGSIAEFFVTHGESSFRREEERVVADLLDSPRPSVVSLGGGAILSESTRALLAAHLVVMLDMSAEQARRRIGDGSTRPVLGSDPMRRWAEVYTEREPLYRGVADVVIPAGDAPVARRAVTIVEALTVHTRRRPPTPGPRQEASQP